jgi:hypothetical protein
VDDPLRQAFRDGRLPNARLADQAGVVLDAAAENLNHALDLGEAAHQWIEFVVARQLSEVAPELVQRGRARALPAVGLRVVPFLHRVDLAAGPLQVGAQLDQHPRRQAVPLPDQAQQQVFGANVVVVELAGLFVGQVDHPLGARRELHVLAEAAVTPGNLSLDVGADAAQGHPEPVQDAGGDAVALAHQAQQQVLRADVVLTQAGGFFLREEHHAPRPLGETLPHSVLTLPLYQTAPKSIFG